MNLAARAGKLWPRTLFARLMVILVVGLTLAQGLSFGVVLIERMQAANKLMLGNLELDVAGSVAILDRLPPAERPMWVERLNRGSYTYLLDAGTAGPALASPMSQRAATAIVGVLEPRYRTAVNAVPGPGEHFQVHLTLADGSPLTVDVKPSGIVLSTWLPVLFCVQLAMIGACAWLAVRLVTRPLKQLAAAAENLGPDLKGDRIPEQGPDEVVHAATAFNAMQARIAGYLSERIQILAAISHDLQTPITRMRLRLDLMENCETRAKLHGDLREMEHLVREGVTYARTLHGGAETPVRIDPDALLDSIACDYRDGGQPIAIDGHLDAPVVTRPQALRRILTNLIDNALKFGSDVSVAVDRTQDGQLSIAVRDRGPGIPDAELERVLQPFYRLEASRNRGTGGTGLGLAIAQQLANALGGKLALANRTEGGLEARLTLPA
ncbi:MULTISPECIES: ATP-binding protein [unclassified Cupriavidus]|uniref:ATP-binding protein n=1 Tax=unclassified Cupriavidus TaxID=2640874 RepID=UPI00313C9AFE